MKTISAQELKQKIDSTGTSVSVVHVLPKEHYAKKHIPQSINIPLEELEEKSQEMLPNKEMEIVVYCANASCQASPKAAEKLEAMGYTNVSDFEGGVEGWEKADYELEGAEAKVHPQGSKKTAEAGCGC